MVITGPQYDACVIALAPWRGTGAAGTPAHAAAARVSAAQAQSQVPGSAGRQGAWVRTADSGVSQRNVQPCAPAHAPRPCRWANILRLCSAAASGPPEACGASSQAASAPACKDAPSSPAPGSASRLARSDRGRRTALHAWLPLRARDGPLTPTAGSPGKHDSKIGHSWAYELRSAGPAHCILSLTANTHGLRAARRSSAQAHHNRPTPLSSSLPEPASLGHLVDGLRNRCSCAAVGCW